MQASNTIDTEWVEFHCLHISNNYDFLPKEFPDSNNKCLFWFIFELKDTFPAPI